jgi:aryl-alcohol dehydrogenase-like predicted oxidoreductase
VHAALECGINFFDTADVYGDHLSEEYLGAAIKGMDRSQIIIATKFAAPMGDGALNRGASRHHVMNAVEASLKRLGTDYIDLYQQHGPDPATPVEETLAALDDLVRAGKVRYLGNSNYAGWQIADAHWTAKQRGLNRFVTAQNQYNLLDRRVEREVLPACQRFGLGMLPYFPLASGLLTGKYQRGAEPPEGSRLANRPAMGKSALTDHNFDVLDRLTGFAREQGHDLLELAMGWLASMPYVSSVISGATSPDQVRANVKSAEWRLTSEQMSRVAELSGRQGAR